jgi:hypothetical protein
MGKAFFLTNRNFEANLTSSLSVLNQNFMDPSLSRGKLWCKPLKSFQRLSKSNSKGTIDTTDERSQSLTLKSIDDNRAIKIQQGIPANPNQNLGSKREIDVKDGYNPLSTNKRVLKKRISSANPTLAQSSLDARGKFWFFYG